MSALPASAPPRRILIALDASAPSMAALDAAATLAACLGAELLGIFIEDVDLLHLAGLPFAAEVGMLSARPRPLALEEMERHLRVQRARAEQALVQVAQRLGLRWSFRAVRGRIVPELLLAALETDLIALGTVSAEFNRGAWLGSTTRAMMAQTARPLLIAPRGATLRSPLAVACTDSRGSLQALALAAQLAQRLKDGGVVVLLIADDAPGEARLRREFDALLESTGVKARYRSLADPGVDELARALRAEGAGTLVLATDVLAFDVAAVRHLLERMDLAVVLTGAVHSVVVQSARTSAGS